VDLLVAKQVSLRTGTASEEDRLGEVAASPNSQNQRRASYKQGILYFEVLGGLLGQKSKKELMKTLGVILSVIVVFFVAFVRHSMSTGSCQKVKTNSCQESTPKPVVEEANTVVKESSPKPAVEEASADVVVKEISQESDPKQEDYNSDTDWNYEGESEEEFAMKLDWIGNF
jgi:hypothetical protein